MVCVHTHTLAKYLAQFPEGDAQRDKLVLKILQLELSIYISPDEDVNDTTIYDYHNDNHYDWQEGELFCSEGNIQCLQKNKYRK